MSFEALVGDGLPRHQIDLNFLTDKHMEVHALQQRRIEVFLSFNDTDSIADFVASNGKMIRK
jgi:hypothetical protein